MGSPFDEDDFFKRYWRMLVPDTIPRNSRLPVFSNGRGCELFDVNGRRYLDFCAQIGVAPIGHNHPYLVEAEYQYAALRRGASLAEGRPGLLHEMIASDFYFSFEIVHNGEVVEVSQPALAEMLARHSFGSTAKIIKQVDGGKINNTVIAKFIPWLTKKRLGLAFDGAFHGRPGHALAATKSKPVHQEGFLVPDGIFHLPYPDTKEKLDECYRRLKQLPLADIGYVIFELVQGEGGINPANFYTVKFLNFLWDKGILLVDDEIQTGFGRTGTWFAYQQFGIKPDIITVSKAIPLSAAIFDSENPRLKGHENFPEGGDSSTFQWNPPNVLWAEAVILAMEKGKYVEHGHEMAKILEAGIDRVITKSLPDGIPQVGPHYKREGLGLHQGVKFWKRLRDGSDVPDPEMRDAVVNRLLECGIVTLGAGNRDINPAIRFMPSLVVTEKEIGELLCALEIALIHTRHSVK